MTLLITGGAGFLGSHFARHALAQGEEIAIVDALTYAGDARRVAQLPGPPRFDHLDVRDPRFIQLMRSIDPNVVVHFAAETHVTRSETAVQVFNAANVEGTSAALSAARAADVKLFVHISTDEVYGPCPGPPFRESQKESGAGSATSPYAISKALADDVALRGDWDVPVIVVRPTNCYGPGQYPEKAIARWIIRSLNGTRLPVWGNGTQVRDWMFVDDLCRALDVVIERGASGEAYNVGPASAEVTNLEVARMIARLGALGDDAVYLSAYDRPQHDQRYAIDPSKIRALGWQPTTSLSSGLTHTYEWYRNNRKWWELLIDPAERIYNDDAAKAVP